MKTTSNNTLVSNLKDLLRRCITGASNMWSKETKCVCCCCSGNSYESAGRAGCLFYLKYRLFDPAAASTSCSLRWQGMNSKAWRGHVESESAVWLIEWNGLDWSGPQVVIRTDHLWVSTMCLDYLSSNRHHICIHSAQTDLFFFLNVKCPQCFLTFCGYTANKWFTPLIHRPVSESRRNSSDRIHDEQNWI